MPYSYIGIAMKHDAVPDEMKTSPMYYIQDYAKSLIAMMFSQRLSDAAQKADCPFTSASAYDGEYIYSKTKDAFQVEADAKEGRVGFLINAQALCADRDTKAGNALAFPQATRLALVCFGLNGSVFGLAVVRSGVRGAMAYGLTANT